MSSTLRGRVTRAVNTLKKHLADLEARENQIVDRVRQQDPGILSEVDQIIGDLKSAASNCESAFSTLVTQINQMPDAATRQAEDDKASELTNAADGMEDTLDKFRESLLTLRRLRTSLHGKTPESDTSDTNPASASETHADRDSIEREELHNLDSANQGVPGENTADSNDSNGTMASSEDILNVSEEIVPTLRQTLQGGLPSGEASLDLRNFLSTDSTRLKLPSFNGKKSDFLRFWSLFEATIDQSSLNNTVKLHILLSHLSGDAAQLVSGFSFDTRNYEAVKQTLKERYNSKGSVERRLYEDLLSLKRTSMDFPSFVDRLESILNQMSAYSIDIEVESIRMNVEDSLPSWVRPHLLQAQLLSDHWTTAVLRKTLKKLALIADSKSRTASETITVVSANSKKQNNSNSKKKSNKPFSPATTTAKTTTTSSQSRSDVNGRSSKFCTFCKIKGHTVDECRKKKAQSSAPSTAHSAAAITEEIQELPKVLMSTSVVEQEEVPLMLVEAPIVNLTTGSRVQALIFLDCGAQGNFVSEKLASALDLDLHSQSSMNVQCFGGFFKRMNCANTRLGVQQLDGQTVPLAAKCIETVVDRLPYIRILPNDALLRQTRIPSLLIGNRDMWKFVKGPSDKVIEGFQCIDSTLGTLLGGQDQLKQVTSTLTAAVGIDARALDKQIEDWNSLETIGIHEPINQDDDELAWNMLKDQITFEDGRYQVPLPFKDETPRMPDNLGLCIKQLVATRKRMLTNKSMKISADTIVNEWRSTGVIEAVPLDQVSHPEGVLTVYSPFHLVEKPSSKSTPFRLVHNGSASLKGLPSLNKLLCRGPVLLPNMVGVMMRFREDPVVAMADVTKAFLQLGLQKPCRDALRFVYPIDWSKPITASNLIHYRFCRINFGLICSPFLLAGTFKIHFEKILPYGPDILRDSYVDNLLIRGQSSEEVRLKMDFAIEEMRKIGMELSQFCTSNTELQQLWKQESQSCNFLGVNWTTDDDMLNFKFDSMDLSELTKRSLLSQLCSRFDPLGLCFPTILPWKLAVQRLWKDKKEWDEPVSQSQLQQMANLDIINPRISVPRLVSLSKEVDLVIFVDASKDAFAAVAYMVSPNELPSLLLCKSRLAPIGGSTIPRLELLAAVLGVRLGRFIRQETSKIIRSTTLYGDSMVVLHWIHDKEANVPSFNRKRLEEIRSFENCDFRYVNTKENPADLATRGCTSAELANNDLWFHGPDYLQLPREKWPCKEIKVKEEPAQQETPLICAAVQPTPSTTLQVERFSSFPKLLSTMVCILIFLKKLATLKFCHWDPSKKARIVLIKEAQERCPPSPDQLKNLQLYRDGFGLWRTKGRLQNSDIAKEAKDPILLPKADPLTKLMILHIHNGCAHGSVATTLAQLRQLYWIPSGRSTVKKAIGTCTQCKRRKPPPFALPVPPQLPASRVKESNPFAYCGIDLAGPFQVKLDCGDLIKVWIVLFTCLSSRAVHVEITHGLSAAQLLNCLRKFVARRGRPLTIYSDNGTNFKGAVDTVKTWKEEQGEVAYCEPLDLKWYFIPSLSPWCGGVYERMIALIKQALRRSIPRKLLSMDEMSTFVTEAEAVVNCRPLTYIADDNTILRPIDLICPRIMPGLPLMNTDHCDDDHGFLESPIANMWMEAKHRVSKFWDIWRSDYLPALRERTKNGLKQPKSLANRPPQLGEVVLLDEPNVSSSHWRLARITALHHSSDGLIRSVEVKTANGRTSRRSIATVHPLELRTIQEIPMEHSEKTDESKTKDSDATTEPTGEAQSAQDVEATSVPNQPYSLRKRKPVNYAFFALAIFCLLLTPTTSGNSCPSDAEVVYRQHCVSSGYVVGRQNEKYCWSKINCSTGSLRPLNGFETFDQDHCGKRCSCPLWTTGCTFQRTTWNPERGFQLLEQVKPELRTYRISPNDTAVSTLMSCVMAPDRTIHYVNNLDVVLSNSMSPPFTCFGTGEVTGDDLFCQSHPCTNGTRFCAANHLETAVLNTPSGHVPIIGWGSKHVKTYQSTREKSSACNFSISCEKLGGVILKDVQLCQPDFMEICLRDVCRRYDSIQLKYVRPPRNLRLSTQDYSVNLWKSGAKIAQKQLLCNPVEVCSLIQCTLCLEFLLHLPCIFNSIIAGFTVLTILILIIWTFRRKCRSHRRLPTARRRRRHAKLLELIPLLLLAVNGISACDTAASFQATSHTCSILQTGSVSCHFEETTVVSLRNGVDTCLVFNDGKQRTMSRVRLEADFYHRCLPRTMFFTRQMKTSTQTVRRCPGLGSCQNDFCLKTTSNTSVAEFSRFNSITGVSRCEQACGGFSCGCLTFGSGCRFSRTTADVAVAPEIAIIECTWEKVAVITITEESSSTTKRHQVTLLPGETSTKDHINITVSLHHIDFATDTPLERHFANLEFNNKTMISLLNEKELQSAKLLRCGPNGTDCHLDHSLLSCQTADGIVKCLPGDNLRLTTALEKRRIPLYHDSKHYTAQDKKILADESGAANLQINVHGYEAILETEMSSCDMKFIELTGCYGCHEGSTLTYDCTTNFGRHIAEVKCPSTSFTVVCGPGGPRTTFINLDSSTIEETCHLRCPGSKSTFQLAAKLDFLSDDMDGWTSEDDSQDDYMERNFVNEWMDKLKTDATTMFNGMIFIAAENCTGVYCMSITSQPKGELLPFSYFGCYSQAWSKFPYLKPGVYTYGNSSFYLCDKPLCNRFKDGYGNDRLVEDRLNRTEEQYKCNCPTNETVKTNAASSKDRLTEVIVLIIIFFVARVDC